jgi:hypothetical protein
MNCNLECGLCGDKLDEDGRCPDCGFAICQNCSEKTPRDEMQFTTDCHGIAFRYVCIDCYDKLMEDGYDGQYYDERDECLAYDY